MKKILIVDYVKNRFSYKQGKTLFFHDVRGHYFNMACHM
jgi:hypothetical protein